VSSDDYVAAKSDTRIALAELLEALTGKDPREDPATYVLLDRFMDELDYMAQCAGEED